jgi:hypothetical protein
MAEIHLREGTPMCKVPSFAAGYVLLMITHHIEHIPIHKKIYNYLSEVTLSFTLDPLFQWYLQSNEILYISYIITTVCLSVR